MTKTFDAESIRDQLIEKLRPSGWADRLKTFVYSEDFIKILNKLWELKQEGKRWAPEMKNVFNAFMQCPYDKLNTVFILQDPYHSLRDGKAVADGIATSCSVTGVMQPSLKYMLQAVHKTVYPEQDYNYDPDLKRWSNQGILMLNTALTVEIGKPGSHFEIWKNFSSFLIDTLSTINSGLVFVLLGKKSQEYEPLINENSHYILRASHPASAAYAKNSEWDCNNVFNNVNKILYENNKLNIKW